MLCYSMVSSYLGLYLNLLQRVVFHDRVLCYKSTCGRTPSIHDFFIYAKFMSFCKWIKQRNYVHKWIKQWNYRKREEHSKQKEIKVKRFVHTRTLLSHFKIVHLSYNDFVGSWSNCGLFWFYLVYYALLFNGFILSRIVPKSLAKGSLPW